MTAFAGLIQIERVHLYCERRVLILQGRGFARNSNALRNKLPCWSAIPRIAIIENTFDVRDARDTPRQGPVSHRPMNAPNSSNCAGLLGI